MQVNAIDDLSESLNNLNIKKENNLINEKNNDYSHNDEEKNNSDKENDDDEIISEYEIMNDIY